VTPEDLSDVSKLQKLLARPEVFTEEELAELRRLAPVSLYLGPNQVQVAEFRVMVELIDTIHRFDKASGALVNTTNVLTKRILWITVGAVFIGLVQLAIAVITLFSSK
jgi:hypothetical protein